MVPTIGKYKLGGEDGHTPEAITDLMEWASWVETADRRVAKDYVDEVEISTVFLSIDYALVAGQRPLLFESMVFGGTHDGYQERYCTWDEAITGHARILDALRKGLDLNEETTS